MKIRKIRYVIPIALSLCLLLTMPTPIISQQTPEQSTWVIMYGRIERFGMDPAYGWCGAYAKVREWARVYAAWFPYGGPQIPEICNFYAAKLVNASIIELDYLGYDFYVEGIWNVYNVTFIYEPGTEPGNYSLTITPVVINGLGTLEIIGNWTSFTIKIETMEEVAGTVVFHAVRPREIPLGDVSGVQVGIPDGEVNIWDLVHAAKAYGSTPGNPLLPNYDFSLDFNFNYEIDIYDLTTIAVNIGKTYETD